MNLQRGQYSLDHLAVMPDSEPCQVCGEADGFVSKWVETYNRGYGLTVQHTIGHAGCIRKDNAEVGLYPVAAEEDC